MRCIFICCAVSYLSLLARESLPCAIDISTYVKSARKNYQPTVCHTQCSGEPIGHCIIRPSRLDSYRFDCVRLGQGGLLRLSKKAASKTDVKQEDLRMQRTNQLYGMLCASFLSFPSPDTPLPSYLDVPCASRCKSNSLTLLLWGEVLASGGRYMDVSLRWLQSNFCCITQHGAKLNVNEWAFLQQLGAGCGTWWTHQRSSGVSWTHMPTWRLPSDICRLARFTGSWLEARPASSRPNSPWLEPCGPT